MADSERRRCHPVCGGTNESASPRGTGGDSADSRARIGIFPFSFLASLPPTSPRDVSIFLFLRDSCDAAVLQPTRLS